MFLILVSPSTKSFGFWMLNENKPVELFTFIFLFIGGCLGIYYTFQLKKSLDLQTSLFYGIFSFFLIIVAMEEIAWGQWFFHFETPAEWAKINRQQETTLHNLEMMGGHNEILRLVFGIGGLIGVLLRNYPMFKKIGASKIIINWFLVIIFLSILDYLEGEGLIDINKAWNMAINSSSELTELLIAISGFLYVFLNFRFLKTTLNIKQLKAI